MNRSLALVLRSKYIVTALGRSGVDRSQSAKPELSGLYFGIITFYYHRSTFLQLFTISFLLLFPHPYIPSELPG